MNMKTFSIALIIGLVVGGGAGFLAASAQGVNESSISGTIQSLQSQVSSLSAAVASKDADIQALQGQVAELKEQLPPLKKGSWNHLKTFNGSGPITTDYFYIKQAEARLTWNFTEVGSVPYIVVYLYKENQSDLWTWSSDIQQTNSGTTYIHGLEATNYYITVDSSTSVENWTVSIEVWVPS